MLEELRKDGVERIEAVFEGGGDSGGLERLEVFPGNKGNRDRSRVREWLQKDIVSKVGFDWRNDEGGTIKIKIDVRSGEMSTKCYRRIVTEEFVSEEIEKL